MARPEDAALLEALEVQGRELSYAQSRLESMRATLLPPPASFWRGAAGRAYEAERSGLGDVISQGLANLTDASALTALAVQRVMARV